MAKKSSTILGQKVEGKYDLERIGLFSETAYITGKYYPKKPPPSQEKPNLLCSGPKIKDGTQIGYFEPKFKRIFSKEAIKGRGRPKPPQKFKNITKQPFFLTGANKKHSSPGDYYGCFSGNIEHFSNVRWPKPPFVRPKKNLFSSPAKKGGPGYPNIGLSRYPEHQPDRYGLKPVYKEYGYIRAGPYYNSHFTCPYFDLNPFKDPDSMKPGPTYVPPKEKPVNIIEPGKFIPTGPGKKQGNCHAGCFNPFPEHKSDRTRPQKTPSENVFMPLPIAPKTFYYDSIVNRNVDHKVSFDNYASIEPTYTKYLLA